ncbi:sigma-E factor negative regulatory protein [Marinomonas sp.]|uniref:sigma-E factor negative regulatory protein n=1 Tax=Marinomonas sp. TaxID=1904862 RepID=UPI003BAB5AAC
MTALNGSFPKNDCSRDNDSTRENDGFQEHNSSEEVHSSLSAMFDGEATEQDLERLIDEDSAELSCQLEAYHLIQQALHKESPVAVGLEDSLMRRVRAGINVDASFPEEQSAKNLLPFVLSSENRASRPVWRVALSSVAVAASVAFVVIFGGNELLTPGSETPNLVAEVRSPSTNNMVVTPLAELDKDTLQIDNVRLQNYLRQHAEQAAMTVGQGMIPMARVVSYPIKE